MSATPEPLVQVTEKSSSVMGHYQHILRHRLLLMAVLALAILASLTNGLSLPMPLSLRCSPP